MKYTLVISDRVWLKAISYCLEEQLKMKRAFNQDHRQVWEKRTGGVLNKHTLRASYRLEEIDLGML